MLTCSIASAGLLLIKGKPWLKITPLAVIWPLFQGITGLVPFPVNIDMFSGSGSGWTQGAVRREWRVLAKRRNAAGDRFPTRPQGATQRRQYGVAVLDKGAPFSADCALSWRRCVALNMSILTGKGTRCLSSLVAVGCLFTVSELS